MLVCAILNIVRIWVQIAIQGSSYIPLRTVCLKDNVCFEVRQYGLSAMLEIVLWLLKYLIKSFTNPNHFTILTIPVYTSVSKEATKVSASKVEMAEAVQKAHENMANLQAKSHSRHRQLAINMLCDISDQNARENSSS